MLPTVVIQYEPRMVVLLPSVAESGDLVVPLPTLVVCGMSDMESSREIVFDYSDLVPNDYSDLVPLSFRSLGAVFERLFRLFRSCSRQSYAYA